MTPHSKPVRVMHVLYRLQAGGTEYGVIKLVNGLDRSLVASSICSSTPATDVKGLLRPDVVLHECARRSGNDPKFVWDLVRLFRRERPHIVHTHAWGTLCEGLLAARLAGVPQVVHGEHGTLQLRPHQARVQRFAWGRVDRLLSVSSRLAETMSKATGYPLERIEVIRNGVDLSRFTSVDRTEARRQLNLAPDTIAIGTAGRLVPVKDQTLLLEAFAQLARRGLTFVGGADELIDEGTTGCTVPASNAAALGDAIERVARDAELLRRMGRAGRERALMQFALDRMLRDYTNVYCGSAGVTTSARPQVVEKGAMRCLPHS